MKNKLTKKLLSAVLALAMLLSLVPAASLTASAVSVAEEWTTDITVTETRTINGNVLVKSDITLTIAEGVTLTVNGRVIASGMTLTADGGGTLVVNGVNGPNGTDHNPVGGVYNGTAGYSGGPGISGNIYVAGASVVVNGGNGGNGGSSETDGAAGGNGGNAIDGAVTLESGSITATGGKGGSGGVILMGGSGANGSDGKAVTGTITGVSVEESDDGSTWTVVSGTSSDKRYVKATTLVTYLEWDEIKQELVEKTCENYTVMTSATSYAFQKDKWYVVNKGATVTITNTITLSGAKNGPVHLIVCDGATLNAEKGINNTFENANNRLYIHAQSTGENMGKLNFGAPGIQYRNLTIDGGFITATGSQGINGATSVTINGGAINATGSDGIQSQGSVTINGGIVNATSTGAGNKPTGIYVYDGVYGTGGSVTINGGTVTASGGKWGIYATNRNSKGTVTINGGSVTASGTDLGVSTDTVSLDPGLSVKAGDSEATASNVTSSFAVAHIQKWVHIEPHTHSFTYSADGDTITATCAGTDENGNDCPLENLTATLTIGAPTMTIYGQTGEGVSAEATITDENNIRGDAAVSYYKATKNEEDDTYAKSGDALAAAPTDAGDYIAEITLGTGEGAATASVVYTIAKADPTANAPTGATATYGQTLANVTLTNPSGNTAGTWAWVDDTQSVGNVISPAATFKANFTPTDTNNYNVAENIDVTVTVGKADPTYTVPAGLTAAVNSLLSAVALPDGWSWKDGTQNVGDFGDKSFKATFTPEDTANYNAVSDIDVPVGVRNVPEYDIPDGLTAGYGETLADVLLPDGWTWDDSTLKVGDLGENVHKATFTPEDTANYCVVSGIDVIVTVGKGTIRNYTKPTAAHIKYPQTLAEATLTGGDTGDIEGVWSWLIPDVQPTSEQSGSSFELIFTPTGDYAELYNPIVTRLAVIVEPAEFEPDSISDADEDITLYGEFADGVGLELTPITHNQSAYLALLRASSRDASGLRKLVLFKTMTLTGAEEAYNGTLTLTSFVGEKRAGETVSAWFFIDGAPVNYVGTVDADGVLVIENVAL